MPQFRKKPVVIEARQWIGGFDDNPEILDWIKSEGGYAGYIPATSLKGGRIAIKTLEGAAIAQLGDWIIKGVKGEFYPCKPDIFEATYDLVTDKLPSFEFKNLPTAEMVDWIINGDTGTSSETMLSFHLGTPKKHRRPPGDEWDVERCIKLVDKCPEIRESFAGLAETNPVWGVILPKWDELCQVYREQGFHPMGDMYRALLKENDLR